MDLLSFKRAFLWRICAFLRSNELFSFYWMFSGEGSKRMSKNLVKLETGYNPMCPNEAARQNSKLNEQRKKALQSVVEALEPLATNIDRARIMSCACEYYSIDRDTILIFLGLQY